MLPWNERPVEIANLFNPAFCCILLSRAVEAYVDERKEGMSFSLAFLVLPIVLHRFTREKLPRSITTKMHVWLQDNPEVRVDFAARTKQLIPFTREGLIYALNSRLLIIDAEGRFLKLDNELRRPLWPSNSEPEAIRSRAGFVGRWLARSGDDLTIFVMWGIQL